MCYIKPARLANWSFLLVTPVLRFFSQLLKGTITYAILLPNPRPEMWFLSRVHSKLSPCFRYICSMLFFFLHLNFLKNRKKNPCPPPPNFRELAPLLPAGLAASPFSLKGCILTVKSRLSEQYLKFEV